MPDPKSLSSMTPDQQRALLQKLLQEKAAATKCFPMAAGQQGLWNAFRRDPSSTTFNVFLPSRVRSKLNVDALRRSIEFLVDRHACLRTTFSDADQQLRQTVKDHLPPEFTIVDASEMSESEIRKRVVKATQRPFDLENGPLLRLLVLQKADDDFVILANTHHIVVDFWSLILILTELRQAYPAFAANREPEFPPANNNYSAFVESQSKMLAGPEGQRLSEHWQQTLRDAPTVLEWATDFRRPANFSGHADVTPLTFPPETAQRITNIAAKAQTTTTAVVMAALQVFIRRSTRQDSFLIGSPFSGRGHRMFEDTVGFFVNMLPLRADLSGNPSFLTVVQNVGQTVLTALEHENFPFAEIVRQVGPPRDPSRPPMFQVSATFEKSHVREEHGRGGFLFPSEQEFADFGGLQQESYYIPHPTCHYDVEFIFEQTDEELRGMICYCKDLFDSETAAQMATNFQTLLASLLDEPTIAINSASWCPIALPVDVSEGAPTTLVDLVSHDSSALATQDNGQTQTYQQFQQSAATIAANLHQRGIGRGDYVCVCADRGVSAITAILGVMKSGAAVIPIDAKEPAVACADLIDDTQAKLIIVQRDCEWASGSTANVVTIDELTVESTALGQPQPPKPDDVAYVIYTSGTTGRPKGVMVSHDAIANTLRWRSDQVVLEPSDRLLMPFSHQFDAGFGMTFSILAQGAQVIWVDDQTDRDIDALIAQVIREQITVLMAVPSLLRLIIAHPRFKECRCIQQIWAGGESMPVELPELIWEHSAAKIWNFYGPTEAAVEATAHEVKEQDSRRPIPIGKPILNTEVLVLDDSFNRVPDTVPGQLAIRGRGLALGYLNRPELTQQKFVSLQNADGSSSRAYLTGDIGRRRTDGQLEFIGRIDDQVKIGGYRIELEEIESVTRFHPSVQNAAVKVIHADTSAAQLAAFITVVDPKSDHQQLIDSLRRHVADHLPAYKRPNAWQILGELPIGSSGKVNRKRLPDSVDQASTVDYVAPSTPLERYLADMWADMLEVTPVGVNQNFFQLGGSSLQAAMMTSKLSEALGVHVPTALLFDLADIAKLAQRLVQLYETEMASRFSMESVTAYSRSVMTDIHSATGGESNVTAANHPLLAPLKKSGDRPPIFMIHPPGGIVVCYRELADQLHEQQPLFAIRSRGLHGREPLPSSLAEMAADYIEAIKVAQADGPYTLGGWSLGGIIAYEIAQQLMQQGDEVEKLILLDSTIPAGSTDLVDDSEMASGQEYGLDLTLDELSELNAKDQLPFLWQHAVNLGVLKDETPQEVVQQVIEDLQSLFHNHVELSSNYSIKPIDTSILLVRPSEVPFEIKTSEDRGWSKLANDVQVQYVGGHHHSMVQMPQVKQLASLLVQ